jgi:CubicO group peptidase (beta-lactamase class C family)
MRVLALLVFVTTGLAAQARDTLAPPRTIPELQARIREVLAETRTPGMGITIVTRDSILWVAGIGTADLASGRPATDTTLFRIGSTSKAFTALMTLLLQQDGRLSLEDPVWAHAPEIVYHNKWENTDPVRIVHLLEHATGWDDMALKDYALDDSTITLRAGLDYNPKTRTCRWRPGSRVSYCNSGPPVAAYIIEKLVGRPFEDLVRERLFAPIGMTTATYFPPQPRERLATNYHADGKTPEDYWYISERPAGSINASARDMAHYVQFLLNRGRVGDQEILPPEAIKRMERPRSSLTARSGLALGYGLNLSSYVDSGFVWVGHDGGVNGGLTNMAYRPEQGVGFAFMINTGNAKAFGQISRLLRDFLTKDQPRPPPPPLAPLSALARERTGWYRPDNPRIERIDFLTRLLGLMRVTANDTALRVKPLFGGAKQLLPVSERLFRQASDPVATFALVDDPENGRSEAIEWMGYLLPGSFHHAWTPLVWLELGTVAVFVVTTALTLLFALIWVPRWLFRRLRTVPKLRTRTWPLLATLSLVVFVAVFMATSDDPIVLLGHPTAWAITLTVCTCVFPLASIAGLISALRAADVRFGVRWLALVASAVNVIVAVYLGWFGMIAWRSWV